MLNDIVPEHPIGMTWDKNTSRSVGIPNGFARYKFGVLKWRKERIDNVNVQSNSFQCYVPDVAIKLIVGR